MLMSYRFGESGDHRLGEGTVNEHSPFVLQLCVVEPPLEPRGVITILAVVLALPEVVIIPLTFPFISALRLSSVM